MADGLPFIQLASNFEEDAETVMFEHLAGGRGDRWTLVRIWLWVARHRPDGVLSDLQPVILARASGWTGDPEDLMGCLYGAGLLVTEEVGGQEALRFRGWGKRYDGALAKRRRDRERMSRRRSGDVAATSQDGPTTSPTVRATSPVRGEERRGEDRRGSPPSEGVQGEDAGALPPPASPEPPPKAQAGQPKAKRAPKAQGKPWPTIDDFARQRGQELQARFPALDGKNGRPSLRDLCERVWAHRETMAPSKRYRDPWQTICAWAERDYSRHRYSHERDAQAATVAKGQNAPVRASSRWRKRGVEPAAEDTHGTPISLPPGYVWDERDENCLERGMHWLGQSWSERPRRPPPDATEAS